MKNSILKLVLATILGPILPLTTISSAASAGAETGATAGGTTTVQRFYVVVPQFVGSYYADTFSWSGPGPWWGPATYVTRSGGEEPHGAPPDVARVSLHVRPRKSALLVDGTDLGEARDYRAGYHPLWLSPGEHELELSHPGYQTLRVRLDAQKGQAQDLHYRLSSGEGIDPRSSDLSSARAGSHGKPATS